MQTNSLIMVNKLKFFLAFIILAFVGCNEKQKTKENAVPEKTIEIPKTEKKASDTQNKKTSFGGNWINKKYMDRLMATKSPKKSQDVALVTMLILPDNFNQNATMVLNFHEGITGKVIPKGDSFEIQSPESDVPPTIFQLKNGRIKTGKDEFIKLKTHSANNNYKVAEQLLFAGKYEMDGKQVEFTPNGKVSGLDTFTYYSVLIDYYDAGMQVDQMRLGKSRENSKLYGFSFKKNNLSIYELKCVNSVGDFCDVVKNGKRLYKLKKTT